MFIEKHGLWSQEQRAQAAELRKRVAGEKLDLVRLAWADPHGASRAKALSVPVFLESLASGYNINVATTTLDSAGGRVFRSFTRGGGMGLDEMTGSPNLVVVPDPSTFRVLPWAPNIGWILCDEYFRDGTPFHFSPRHLLRRQLKRLDYDMRVGLEVEWYLARVAEQELSDEHVGIPGLRGRPIRTTPIEPGYSYHSETNMDIMQPVFDELAKTYSRLGLPLRSIENEWGPGQVECTFSAQSALRTADDLVLFRTATRQVCRRMGCFATFMARPALKGYYASGWHLHESLVDGKKNVFMPDRDGEPLSTIGKSFLGGLLQNAVASTVFATPTVNGYRRFKPNSLAPDRAGWGFDHRGAMIRVLGGAGDPGTRLENRIGEPAANPYLYIASQIVGGIDGIERSLQPGPRDDEPYTAERPMLPKSLGEALDALEKDALFRAEFGEIFIDYFLRLKRSELGRFNEFLQQTKTELGDAPTEWEQNEYFDFF
ncbi:MAG TPA: glutamine synthetase family protein [Burkholderiales bacterium]|nr:glutamine synthetase family protein [Burkholderiales bacterium]